MAEELLYRDKVHSGVDQTRRGRVTQIAKPEVRNSRRAYGFSEPDFKVANPPPRIPWAEKDKLYFSFPSKYGEQPV